MTADCRRPSQERQVLSFTLGRFHSPTPGVSVTAVRGVPINALAQRRSWLLVKKDLERVGIPCEGENVIADFNAAGRHTYITDLIRHDASLTKARELARHSDIPMTMRYTHVGIEEQVKAVNRQSLEQILEHLGGLKQSRGGFF